MRPRVIFRLDEIKAFRIRCSNEKCSHGILLFLDRDRRTLPRRCPSCDADWTKEVVQRHGDIEIMSHVPAHDLKAVEAIEYLIRKREGRPVTVEIEIDDPQHVFSAK